MRHRTPEKGLPCGIEFEKIGLCRTGPQHSRSPKAAYSKAEVAIWSPRHGSRGVILGQKNAAWMSDESRMAAGKCRVFVGSWISRPRGMGRDREFIVGW